MICPRCGREISDTETICPFCFQDIDKNVEFNDFRKDGFIQVSQKDESDTSTAINYMPKYFDLSEFGMLVIAIVFILIVSVFTLFSLRFVQKVDRMMYYVPATYDEPEETEETEPTTYKYVKNISIKNLYGSWRMEDGTQETDHSAAKYFVFQKNGTATQYYGTTKFVGTFKDVSGDDSHTVYIDIEKSFSQQSFNFELIDNDGGSYTLVLTDTRTGYTYYLSKVDNAKEATISPGDEVKINLDKKIYGYWLSKDKKSSYEFNSKAEAVRVSGNTYTRGVWTITDSGSIEFSYLQNEIKTVYLEYKQKGNKLKVRDTIYYKTKK